MKCNDHFAFILTNPINGWNKTRITELRFIKTTISHSKVLQVTFSFTNSVMEDAQHCNDLIRVMQSLDGCSISIDPCEVLGVEMLLPKFPVSSTLPVAPPLIDIGQLVLFIFPDARGGSPVLKGKFPCLEARPPEEDKSSGGPDTIT